MEINEYVHKRDVSSILAKLGADLEAAKAEIENNPTNSQNFKQKIDTIIQNADRDLRLKTQAIVRSRLAKSNVIPINTEKPKEKIEMESVYDDDEYYQEKPKHVFQHRFKPPPPLKTPKIATKLFEESIHSSRKRKRDNNDSSSGSTTPSIKSSTSGGSSVIVSRKLSKQISTSSVKSPNKIEPLSFTSRRKMKDERPKTQIARVRKRVIPITRNHLPHADLHDPTAPLPGGFRRCASFRFPIAAASHSVFR